VRGHRPALVELAGLRVGPDLDGSPRFSTVIRDGGPVDATTWRRMLLTDAELARGVAPDQALRQLAELAHESLVVVYGVGDAIVAQLTDALARFGDGLVRVCDLTQVGAFVCPGHFEPSLREVASALGLRTRLIRRAGPAAELLARALPLMVDAVRGLPPLLLEECRDNADVLGWPSVAPFRDAIAQSVGGQRTALTPANRVAILLRQPWDLQRVERPANQAPPRPDEVRDLLGPGGRVAELHPDYEHRPEQIAMAERVTQAFLDDEVLLVEAGTGVGKSLAYLIPALLWASRTGQRVAVSTATKNLQEQLVRKDIPFLEKVLGFPFRATVVKGRENYVCARKFAEAYERARGSMLTEDRLAALKTLAWACLSPTRDLSSVGEARGGGLAAGEHFAAALRSDGETCHRRACRFSTACAVERLRRVALASDLVILNHALLFATGPATGILPPFQRLVFDEAHLVEDVCTGFLGLAFSARQCQRVLNRLGHRGDPLALLHRLEADVQRSQEALANQIDPAVLGELLSAVETAVASSRALLDVASGLALELAGRSEASRLRLKPESFAGEAGVAFADAAEGLAGDLRLVAGQARALAKRFEEAGDELDVADAQGYANELQGLADSLQEMASAIEIIVAQEDRGYVYWADVERGDVELHAAPIDVGPLLADGILSEMKTVVLTSATLTVEGDAGFFRQRLGLDRLGEGRLACEVFPSSFDYPSQAILAIPTDAPLPTEDAWFSYAVPAIIDLLVASQGRGLVLFTARNMLERAYEACVGPLTAAGIPVLCQYRDGTRSALQAELIRDKASVLFATRSFFAGVDVPGDALECVILTKLPFAVPTDPVIQARCESLQAEGVDAMNDYYIPHAIVTFRQAFGRLIRSRKDRGIIAVLDRRLLSRPYGRRFRASIPRCGEVLCETAGMVARVQRFLSS